MGARERRPPLPLARAARGAMNAQPDGAPVRATEVPPTQLAASRQSVPTTRDHAPWEKPSGPN